MGEHRAWKLRQEMTPDYEVADYSNVVNIAVAENEVIFTFFQVIVPTSDAAEAVAKPVARVAVPPAVADKICQILTDARKG